MSNYTDAIQRSLSAILAKAAPTDRVGLVLYAHKDGILTRPMCTVAEARTTQDWLPTPTTSTLGDPEAATREAIQLFSPKARQRDLVVIGDNGCELKDWIAANERWSGVVKSFAEASKVNRVSMVFCGRGDDQRSIYQRMADLVPSGQGRFQEGLKGLGSILNN